MNSIKKFLIIIVLLLLSYAFVFSNNYQLFIDKYFIFEEKTYAFKDLIYNEEFVGKDFYTLGTITNSDYQIMMDIDDAQDFFDFLDKKVYSNEERTEFFNLIESFQFEPVGKFQGYFVYILSSRFNNLASFICDDNILRKNSDFFSQKAYNYMLDTKDIGILYADIVRFFDELYLVANVNIGFSYNEYLKEIYPNPDTMDVSVFKIITSENDKNLLFSGKFKGYSRERQGTVRINQGT